MDLRFTLPDARHGEELGQLYEWLRTDRDLRTGSEVSLVPAEHEQGRMGLGLEAVQLVLDSGLQLASLAVAIASWRAACAPRSAVTIVHEDAEIRLRRADLEDAAAVLDALERLREARGTHSPGPPSQNSSDPQDGPDGRTGEAGVR